MTKSASATTLAPRHFRWQIADRVAVITQFAEEIDRTTLALALRIVPVEWWQGRLGGTVTPDGRAVVPPTPSS